MKMGDKTFIILYKRYNLFNDNRKTNKFYKKLFKVIKKIKILIYYLKLLLI